MHLVCIALCFWSLPICSSHFAFFTCFSEIYQQAISFIQVLRFQSRRTLATASPCSPYGPYHISTAIVLNRSPILTCTPTQFEQAYYAYQARIRHKYPGQGGHSAWPTALDFCRQATWGRSDSFWLQHPEESTLHLGKFSIHSCRPRCLRCAFPFSLTSSWLWVSEVNIYMLGILLVICDIHVARPIKILMIHSLASTYLFIWGINQFKPVKRPIKTWC